MKDSGIPWIGETPEEWKVPKLKYLCDEYNKNGLMNAETDKYIGLENLMSYSDKYINTDTEYENSSQKICKKGSVLFNKLRPYLAKIIIAPFDGYCTSELLELTEFTGDIRFLKYSLRNPKFINIVNMSTYGAKMPRANAEFIMNQNIPYPSIVEQQRIADFLDSKCSEIDALIDNLKARIEKTKEYKKAVITEAVTKGLDKNAKMKDSGVEWIGEIPEGWSIIPAKYLFTNSDIRKIPDDEQLTSSQKYGIITQKEYMQRENAKIVIATQGIEKWKHVEPNDFIISLRSFQGGLEMSEITGCITWHYVVLKSAKEIIPRYYKWFFKSDVYIKALQNTCNFIRDGQDLRYSNFVQVPLIDMPLTDQYKIADYLDAKCAEIDALLKNYEDQISTLEEYKKSLIYEYVTGKKEVPAV